MIDREKAERVFPEKIKVGDEEYPDLAAMALNLAIARIRDKQRKSLTDDQAANEDVQ